MKPNCYTRQNCNGGGKKTGGVKKSTTVKYGPINTDHTTYPNNTDHIHKIRDMYF
jgi:hypothetical protein